METIKKQETDDVHPHFPQPQELDRSDRCTRREFLRTATRLGVSVSASAFLTACVRGITPPRPSGTVPTKAPVQSRSLMGAAVQSPTYPFEVVVDKDKCTGCEECVGNCPASVLELIDGKAEPVNMDECLGCETCVEVCDFEAITVTEM